MDERKKMSERIVQLSRLALTGRDQDVQMFIRRISRWLRNIDPEASAKLDDLLARSPTRQTPLRSETAAAVPVDTDSRLQLVRHEFPVLLDFEPIWSDEVRRSLEQLVCERQRESDLQRAGLLPTRSVLMTGAPGLGKTLAARWVARQLDRPLLTLDLSAVMSSFLGRTGNNVRYVMDYAKGANCVLLLDEFDAVAKRRDDTAEIGELKRLVAVLLQEIDDWPPTGVLMAATNHPDLLDPAVWRRFDMIVPFPAPNEEQVSSAINLFLGQVAPVEPAAQEILAICFHGMSYSDIEREILRARRDALLRGQPIQERLLRTVRKHTESLSLPDRKRLASKLRNMNLTERQVQDWTGLSRDTIRKVTREEEINKQN